MITAFDFSTGQQESEEDELLVVLHDKAQGAALKLQVSYCFSVSVECTMATNI